ncbi:hypothetical protein Vqi01_16200 [Micromonospora qiuiae]|uniref:(d)CMP kinase n=1 Tax=Micromonospora qiuiae TaxID=502268 RepID=A0ABQ4J8F9_9ACTN|nr:(d)CMP kinase [Micromonospora qiuiae]GIJ26458.1 hypothetical protein Vqi01_16200 [Micromonospora qiuiae]
MSPEQSADLVVGLVTDARPRPFVIAVDGPSAAGTSTLAEVLATRLDASVVHVDDFYRDMPHEQRWALSPEEGLQQYFDWQRLRHEALELLKLGQPARYRPYSWLPAGGLVPAIDQCRQGRRGPVTAARPEVAHRPPEASSPHERHATEAYRGVSARRAACKRRSR